MELEAEFLYRISRKSVGLVKKLLRVMFRSRRSERNIGQWKIRWLRGTVVWYSQKGPRPLSVIRNWCTYTCFMLSVVAKKLRYCKCQHVLGEGLVFHF